MWWLDSLCKAWWVYWAFFFNAKTQGRNVTKYCMPQGRKANDSLFVS
jgi:hypothetical protein